MDKNVDVLAVMDQIISRSLDLSADAALSRKRDAEQVRAAVAELIAERDALRAKLALLKSMAVKHHAYDIHGNGAHWSIGIHTDDCRLEFDAVLAAALARVGGAK